MRSRSVPRLVASLLGTPLTALAPVVVLGALVLGLTAAPAIARGAAPVIRWSGPHLADHSAPLADLTSLSSVACPTAGDCLAVGDSGTIVRAGPPGGVVQTELDGGAGLTGIACPSSALCVIQEAEALLTSTDPTAARPTWRRTAFALPAAGSFKAISCASASLCLAATDNGAVEVSTDPTGGASAWHAVELASPSAGLFLYSATCAPASTLCVVALGGGGGAGGEVATSTDPAGGPAAWTTTATPGLAPMVSVACVPAGALCAGATQLGVVTTSPDPAAGGASWSGGQVIPPVGIVEPVSIACSDAQSCVVALSDGAVAASPDPAAGAASYTVSAVLDAAGFDGSTACPSDATCYVPDRTPGLATVTLAAPPSATVASGFGGFTRLTGLACPATSLCVGVDSAGGIVRSGAPARQTTPWPRTLQHGAAAGLNAVSCPTTRFCVAVGNDDHVATTPRPGTATQWRQATLPFTYPDLEGGPNQPYDLTSISCPSFRFCLAGNSEYGLMASTHPAGGAHAWRFVKFAAFNADLWPAVSCPTSSFCVAGDANFGRIAASTHPLRGGRAWRLSKIAPGVGSLAGGILAVSCPARHFCLAGDSHGLVHWSTAPDGGARAWHAARIDHARLIAARCRSDRFCVVIDSRNRAFVSTDPRAGARSWHATTLATGRAGLGNAAERNLTALACAPHRLCLAGSGVGAVFGGATR